MLLTLCLAPQAEHFMNVNLSSLINSVSGFPHSLQITNSFMYCSIFWFIFSLGILLFKTSLSDSLCPEAASSRRMNFWKCSGFLLMCSAIWKKLVTIVFFPSKCPSTFGISNLSPAFETIFTFLYASSRSFSYESIEGNWREDL